MAGGASLIIASGKRTLEFGGEGSGVGGRVGWTIISEIVGVARGVRAGSADVLSFGAGGGDGPERFEGGPSTENDCATGNGEECRCWKIGKGTNGFGLSSNGCSAARGEGGVTSCSAVVELPCDDDVDGYDTSVSEKG